MSHTNFLQSSSPPAPSLCLLLTFGSGVPKYVPSSLRPPGPESAETGSGTVASAREGGGNAGHGMGWHKGGGRGRVKKTNLLRSFLFSRPVLCVCLAFVCLLSGIIFSICAVLRSLCFASSTLNRVAFHQTIESERAEPRDWGVAQHKE